jgi:hypothetical protein
MEEDTELEEGEAKEPCDPDTDFSYLVSYAIASSSSLFSSFSQLFLVAPPSSPCLCVCLSVSPGLLVLCVCVCVCVCGFVFGLMINSSFWQLPGV